MKIIMVDNFDRDYVDDKLIADNVTPMYASTIVEALNNKYSGDTSPHFFRAVQDEYKLKNENETRLG